MTDNICRYSGDREQAIVSYLYGDSDDGDAAGRTRFEDHLSTCDRCRSEVLAFQGVRASLAGWAPPRVRSEDLPSFGATTAQPPTAHVRERAATQSQSRWREVPAWAQAAAAVLLLGVSAGIANLDIHYDAGGLRVRTGWFAPAPAPATVVDSRPNDDRPWRAELTALEQRLRTDLRPAAAPTEAAASNAARTLDPDTLRRVRMLVEESERRQQRELALRLGEAMREVSVQRQEDLVRIDRNIGAMQSNTGREMLRQRSDLLNYVTVRTAARPQ